jgi:hypothetical protein
VTFSVIFKKEDESENLRHFQHSFVGESLGGASFCNRGSCEKKEVSIAFECDSVLLFYTGVTHRSRIATSTFSFGVLEYSSKLLVSNDKKGPCDSLFCLCGFECEYCCCTIESHRNWIANVNHSRVLAVFTILLVNIKDLFRVFAIGLRITNEYNVVVLISTFSTSLNSSPVRSSIATLKES